MFYDEKKQYMAYAIHYGESPCGCPCTSYSKVYDHTGNKVKMFDDYDAAVIAAKKRMVETNADNWNVV